ncbi:SNase-like [Phytophthora cactorum]|nr:SNase-like [Phytophthora cactorum]
MEEELKKLQALATQQWGQIRSIADNPQELLHIRRPLSSALPSCSALVWPFRRFSTVEDLPNRLFHQEGKIKAVAVNFSDGDTFRARHLPLFRGAGSYDGKLSDHTLQIRLAGIDTPETAKFGNPGQPFGDEAKKWLTSTLEGRKLTLALLHKDQYARVVCLVQYGRWPFRRDASEEILKVGLGQVYRQAGAVYGGKQEVYEELEEKARKKKRGFGSSSDYKARMRAS